MITGQNSFRSDNSLLLALDSRSLSRSLIFSLRAFRFFLIVSLFMSRDLANSELVLSKVFAWHLTQG